MAAPLLAALIALNLQAADQPPGFVDFGKLGPSAEGGEFVEVNIQSSLIAMVSKLTQKHSPEVADLLSGLKAIRVNVIGLKEDNREEIEKRVQGLRAELETKGWERVVSVQKPKEDVAVFMKLRNSEAVDGLVVTVLDAGREAVLVNIVGDIRPEKISNIAERFNIEPLKKLGPVAAK